jgi:hypothetical protein
MFHYLAFISHHFLLARYCMNRSRLNGYQVQAKTLADETDGLSRIIGTELAFYAA